MLYAVTAAGHDEGMAPSQTVRTPAVALTGLALAVTSVVLTRSEPGVSPVGASVAALSLVLTAGLALMVVGALLITRRATLRPGVLLAVAGGGWLVQAWNTPAAGSALLFTIGIASLPLCPVAVGRLVLIYPRPTSAAPDRVVGGAGCVLVVLLGIGPALFLDPFAQGCNQCPANLLLLWNERSWSQGLTTTGLWASILWAVGVLALLTRRFLAASFVQRRLMLPVALPGAALAMLFGWLGARAAFDWTHSVTQEPPVMALQAVLLLLLAAGPGWSGVRSRRARASLTRLSVDVSRSLREQDLRSTLATVLHDPDVKVLYASRDGDTVNNAGEPDSPRDGQTVTALTRRGVPVGWIAHQPEVLDDPAVLEEITATAGLTMDYERLRAESTAQLVSLHASRARIVAAADLERKRLERNLHDGAQQRLITLALALRLSRLSSTQTDQDEDLADRCVAEVTAALADLREVAHGLFPTALLDEGLSAALELLGESSPVVLELRTVPAHRYPAEVESAAYFLVAETMRRCARAWMAVGVTEEPSKVVIEIEVDSALIWADLTAVQDRVGALDGRLSVPPGRFSGRRLRAELPCAS